MSVEGAHNNAWNETGWVSDDRMEVVKDNDSKPLLKLNLFTVASSESKHSIVIFIVPPSCNKDNRGWIHFTSLVLLCLYDIIHSLLFQSPLCLRCLHWIVKCQFFNIQSALSRSKMKVSREASQLWAKYSSISSYLPLNWKPLCILWCHTDTVICDKNVNYIIT